MLSLDSSKFVPTSVTDPASNSSTVKYRYDIGANVWAQSPAPAGQNVGKTTEREFDSIGRLLRETVVNNGAYTRYEYPTNGIQSKAFAPLVDVNSNGADCYGRGDERKLVGRYGPHTHEPLGTPRQHRRLGGDSRWVRWPNGRQALVGSTYNCLKIPDVGTIRGEPR